MALEKVSVVNGKPYVTVSDLFIIKRHQPNAPRQVLPALGLVLVSAGVKIAHDGRHTQLYVPMATRKQNEDNLSWHQPFFLGWVCW